MGYFPVRYNSRVVNYDCRDFIRLATGLLVMGGDSCSKGREFESRHRIPTGWTFFTIICCKNCNVCWKDENKWKNAGVGPFFKKQILEGSGFGSVGRAVASNIRDSRFNSSHLQILFSINCIKSVLKIWKKQKRGREQSIFKTMLYWT